MKEQKIISLISLALMLVLCAYLVNFFAGEWLDMKRGFYSGLYEGGKADSIPAAHRDLVNNRLGIHLSSTPGGIDSLPANPRRPDLVLKPQYAYYQVFSNRELETRNGWRVVLMLGIVVLWLIMIVQLFLFLRDIRKGLVFDSSTIGRLFWVAIAFMVIPIAGYGWDLLYLNSIRELFEGTLYRLEDEAEFNSLLFVTGTFLLLFTYVFKLGMNIKKEMDLTV